MHFLLVYWKKDWTVMSEQEVKCAEFITVCCIL